MSYWIVPYLDVEDNFFRPPAWTELDVWNRSGNHEDRRRSAWSEVGRLAGQLEHLRQLDSGVVEKKRKDAFEVDLDVRGFALNELNTSVKDNTLTVSGSHEEKSEDGSRFSSRHFTRSFRIPDKVKVEDFKSCLAKDGRTLRIEAPMILPAVEDKKEEPKEVPIKVNHFQSKQVQG